MSNKQLLIIGAGFISDKVVKLLTAKGYECVVHDLKTTKLDIRSIYHVNRTILNFPGDKVLLMAAVSDLNVFHSDPQNGFAVNIEGVWNTAKACADHKKHLYYISTCCVYGNTPELPSNELSRPEPSEVYAACKLAGEYIIKGLAASYGLTYNILRIATTYGPNMRAALAPAVFLKAAIKDTPIIIHGGGLQTRTMTYIDDEAEGIVAVIEKGEPNETYNISTEEEISVNEMVQIIVEEVGRTNPTILYGEERVGQTFTEQIDASKAERELGWKAKTTFREGIKKTLQWMKEQGVNNG